MGACARERRRPAGPLPPRGRAGTGLAPGGLAEEWALVSEYVAPPGYAVVAPDWDRELRRPVLLRCDRCAALVLGAADSGRHDAWHDDLVPQPRVSPA
jgi:hypothetical protein